jgi:tetratricopeptide (TPR) repeat protein
MKLLSSMTGVRCSVLLFCVLLATGRAAAQKKIPCPDGEHIEIDVKQLSIKYDASSFAGTLSSLNALSGRLEVAPKQLQEAAVATQQWNQLIVGLAAGYNSCAVTRQQYADGVNRIYPRLKEDGASLEGIRKQIAEGQKADARRLQNLISNFYSNLRQFAQAGGQEIVLQRIDAATEQILQQQKTSTEQIQQQQKTDTDRILARLNELEERNKQAPLATPEAVGAQISELKKTLYAKADAAEAAYNKGYALLDQYRFQEAIPFLQQAVADVPLPDFYLALGRAYRELPNLAKAESVLREGLSLAELDEKHEALLANELGLVLLHKGDLEGALKYAQRALSIDEKVYGPEHPTVAIDANNVGTILHEKGDLEGALQYEQRALTINEKVYGPEHPQVAIIANNVGQILQAKGDLDGALQYTQRALTIQEKVYGPEHPRVAIYASNIGAILKVKGDLEGALKYAQRALSIDEKVYGPEHPTVAIDANNIGQILQDKGDLGGH